jgi:DeoR/GlpR family transcriptional regulator of sugar metabolism
VETQARTGGVSRREKLLGLVLDSGFLTTAELADVLHVSEMTIRRDANRLVEDGLLRTVHGGVATLSTGPVGSGRDYKLRARSSSAAKRAIGRAAARLVSGAGVVAIDAGTTCASAAEALHPDEHTIVLTHSLIVMNELGTRPNVEVIGTGGTLHSRSMSFSGPQSVQLIRNMRIGTLLLGASGIDRRGIYCGNEYDAETKRALIEAAARVVLLTDASKFQIPAMVRTCGLDLIDEAVVDDSITDAQLQTLADSGIQVTVASDG